jgi:PucR-like helix-turn-helix protein
MAADDAQLAAWKERFRKTPLARTVVVELEGRAPEIWRRTFDLLRRDSPEYRNAVDDEFTAESKSHCGELLQAIIAIAAGRLKGADPFAFVRRHAEWRASHHVPLVASLHAYRLAHKTYWTVTREALAAHSRRKGALAAIAMLSGFWIELFELVGSILEEAHAAEEARMGAQNTPLYSALIDDLLRGTEPADPEARRVQALCGVRPGLRSAVAIVRPLPVDNGKQVDAEVAVRSLARLLQQSLPPAFGKLVARRGGEVVAIVSADRDPASRLSKVLGPRFAACAGVSLDKSEVARLPEAVTEARMALEFTGPKRPLVCFAEIELTEFLIRRADKVALRLVPDWAREAHSAHGRDAGLFRTIRAFAECSLNVKQTARRLGVHTNTVYFRLNQIRKRSGVDPRTFAGASYLLAALELLDVHS